MTAPSRISPLRPEREFLAILSARLEAREFDAPPPARPQRQDACPGGPADDYLEMADWSIPVGRQAATADLAHWWARAVDLANRTGRRPALAYRLDSRQAWRVRILASDLAPGLRSFRGEDRTGLGWTVEMGLELFAALVAQREGAV